LHNTLSFYTVTKKCFHINTALPKLVQTTPNLPTGGGGTGKKWSYRGVTGPWKGLIGSERLYRLAWGKDQTRKGYVKGPCRCVSKKNDGNGMTVVVGRVTTKKVARKLRVNCCSSWGPHLGLRRTVQYTVMFLSKPLQPGQTEIYIIHTQY